jgi:hypothetical protein
MEEEITKEELHATLAGIIERNRQQNRKELPKKIIRTLIWVFSILAFIGLIILSGEIFRHEKPFWLWNSQLLKNGSIDAILNIIFYLGFYLSLFISPYLSCLFIGKVFGESMSKKFNKQKAFWISIIFGCSFMIFNTEFLTALHQIVESNWLGFLKYIFFGIVLLFAIIGLCLDD